MGDNADRRTARRGPPPYDLGIDMGTTFTAAAVRVPGERHARVVRLERGADQVPSVVQIGADGRVEVGLEAERRASSTPERVVREYKRRLGDETPMVIDGAAFSADGLAAETVLWAVEQVVEIERAAPRRIAISHPAGWGAYRRTLFVDALAEVGLDDVVLLTEPAAAALAHEAAGALDPGATVAVYDLGGGTFDTAVLRGETAGGVAVLGQAQGLENIGGIDFDEALFWHVCAELGGAVAALDREDPAALRAVAALRRACVAAKERLSVDTEAVVDVELPGLRTRVRVSRGEFEEMIEPALHQTVDVLGEVLDASGVDAGDLDGILLIGGSSRIPLVARVIGREFGCPVTVDADPTSIVARGAALGADTTAVRGAEPARSVTASDRRHRVASVTAAVLGRVAPPSTPATPAHDPAPADVPAWARAEEPTDDPLPFADADDLDPDGPTAPPRPPVSRTPAPQHPGAGGRHARHARPAPGPDRLDRLGDGAVPQRPPLAPRAAPAAGSSPGGSPERPRRRRRAIVALVVGVVVAVFLVLAATVPVIDDPGPSVPAAPAAPAAPGVPALPAPGAGR